MAKSGSDTAYILGDTDRELARLQDQARFFHEETRNALLRGGLSRGMRVLDIGCGAGDVSFIAAEIVGPKGQVCGLDRASASLEKASRRAALAGFTNIQFEGGDIRTYEPSRSFDAVIGRFILLHIDDPVALVKQVKRRVGPGGMLTFMELDISAAAATPESSGRLFQRCLNWIVEVYRKAGYDPDMGSRLYSIFRAAELRPELTCACRIENCDDTTAYEFLAESIGSLAPTMVSLNVASEEELGLNDMSDRLRAEGRSVDQCLVFPRFICASARIG